MHRLAKHFRPYPLAEAQQSLQQWLESPAGQYLLGKEREVIAKLPAMHGYHLMELGITGSGSLLDQFDNLHRFSLSAAADGSDAEADGSAAGAVADFTALPLPSDIIDNALVHHALEFSRKPHLVLNEVARVVAPGGHILLFVLNPLSARGLLKWPSTLLSQSSVYRHHSLRLGRLLDWLRLLSFKPVTVARGGFGPLAADAEQPWCQRWGYGLGLPGGAFNVIVARKQVAKVIPPRGDILKTLKVPNLGWQPREASLPEQTLEYHEES